MRRVSSIETKPANVKLKEDGTVKVLDYGLAKAFADETFAEGDSVLSHSPTLTRQGTQMGVILGTAAYMSPEQAKGKRVDKRTDVWAFGAVVYEMLTGALSPATMSPTPWRRYCVPNRSGRRCPPIYHRRFTRI